MSEFHRYLFDVESFPDKYHDWVSLAHWIYYEYHHPERGYPDTRSTHIFFDVFLPGNDGSYPENMMMKLEEIPNITIHYLKGASSAKIIPLFLYHLTEYYGYWDNNYNITTGSRELILSIRDMRDQAKISNKNYDAQINCRYLKRGYINWLYLDYCIQDGKLLETYSEEYTNPEKFSWNNEEDSYIRQNGITVLIASGSAKLIQNFVKALSYKIRAKCDWSFCGGKAHIEVLPEYVTSAKDLIENPEYMKQFIKEYPYNNDEDKDYFQILSIM